mmetsp:Transcript_48773/g.148384  ORF Transcript_48773/g.148384 Transcript_48773/m.148384 type:complete len:266 (+) Transcript_48773:525-1322(+)
MQAAGNRLPQGILAEVPKEHVLEDRRPAVNATEPDPPQDFLPRVLGQVRRNERGHVPARAAHHRRPDHLGQELVDGRSLLLAVGLGVLSGVLPHDVVPARVEHVEDPDQGQRRRPRQDLRGHPGEERPLCDVGHGAAERRHLLVDQDLGARVLPRPPPSWSFAATTHGATRFVQYPQLFQDPDAVLPLLGLVLPLQTQSEVVQIGSQPGARPRGLAGHAEDQLPGRARRESLPQRVEALLQGGLLRPLDRRIQICEAAGLLEAPR